MPFPQKITLFLVVGVLLILIGVPYAIYNLSRGATEAIGGIYVLMGIGLIGLILLLDRLSLRFIEARWLSVIELVLLLAGYVWYAYTNRTTTLDLSANRSPYFMVVWANDPEVAEKIPHRFPFDKAIRVNDRFFVALDQNEFDRLDIKLPMGWNEASRSKGFSVDAPPYQSVYFYQSEQSRQLSDMEMNSLKEQVLRKLTEN